MSEDDLEFRIIMGKTAVSEIGDSFHEQFYKKDIEVEWKPDGSPVTNIDRMIEGNIKGVLLTIFREDSFSGEEDKDVTGTSGYRWICDPIDGTWGILGRNGTASVCLALQKDGETISAFVYNPFRKELYTANFKDKTTLNGNTLPEKAVSDACLPVCNIALTSYRGNDFEAILQMADKRIIGKWEKKGSSLAYNLAEVAKGPNNCFIARFSRPCSEYDLVPGRYLVEKAGGKVFYDSFSKILVAATDPSVHNKIMQYLENAGFGIGEK